MKKVLTAAAMVLALSMGQFASAAQVYTCQYAGQSFVGPSGLIFWCQYAYQRIIVY